MTDVHRSPPKPTENDTSAATVHSLRVELAQLRGALESRDVIAKGIIRMLARTDSDTAFALLTKISQDTNRRLRDVAVIIGDCAATPTSLPADIRTSWHTRLTAHSEPVAPAGAESFATPKTRGGEAGDHPAV